MTPRAFFNLLRDTVQAWSEDGASRQAAALAYYSVFALAPLLALITLFGTRLLRNWLTQEQILSQILDQLALAVDPETADFLGEVITSFLTTETGTLTTLVTVGIMVYAASGLLVQLQRSLDLIWNVAPAADRGPLGILKDRALAFGFILLAGVLLIATFVASTLLGAVDAYLSPLLPFSFDWLPYVDFAISMVLLVIILAVLFKALPRVKISWRDVWTGSLVTALLLTVGKVGISFYLSRGSVGSAFGAAGSIVVVLIWVYYSAQILLMGAEFTKVYANQYGSQIRPDADAVYRVPVLPPPERPLAQPESAPVAQVESVPRPISPLEPDVRPHYGWLLAAVTTFILGVLLGAQRRR